MARKYFTLEEFLLEWSIWADTRGDDDKPLPHPFLKNTVGLCHGVTLMERLGVASANTADRLHDALLPIDPSVCPFGGSTAYFVEQRERNTHLNEKRRAFVESLAGPLPAGVFNPFRLMLYHPDILKLGHDEMCGLVKETCKKLEQNEVTTSEMQEQYKNSQARNPEATPLQTVVDCLLFLQRLHNKIAAASKKGK